MLFLCLLTLLLSKCCFVFLLCCASFAFNALDPKIILAGLFQGLQDHGPDLHASEAGQGETSLNSRRLLLQVSFLSGSLISTERSTGSSVYRCARPVTLATCSLTAFKPSSLLIKGWHDPHRGRTVWQCLQETVARLARVHGHQLAKVLSAETMIPCNWTWHRFRKGGAHYLLSQNCAEHCPFSLTLLTWVLQEHALCPAAESDLMHPRFSPNT